jgi:hypothetical protein
MAYQIIAKPLGLIKDLKILVRGIPYVVTFIMIQSSECVRLHLLYVVRLSLAKGC